MIDFKNLPDTTTPVDADNLNAIQYTKRILVTTTAEITANTNYTVPQVYHVGKNDLWIYFEGRLLIKDENYIETGVADSESTAIQFKDWNVPVGSKLEFLYK
jgi:hypothetical protein|nr:MAG TPA: hypothetical protein [Caudoviricetes sp.]